MSDLATVLTTVNASYREQLDAQELARCLSDPTLALTKPGHVSSFLTDVPVEAQKAFALEMGIPLPVVADTARAFSNYSGQHYALAA